MRLRAPLLLLAPLSLVAACSSTSAPSPFEAALPVAPGQPWDVAQTALQRLDPGTKVIERIGVRAATARAEVTIAGERFDEVRVAGLSDHPAVRSVVLSAKPDAAACPRFREDILHALGSDWSPAAPEPGATTMTRGGATGRSVRIVCNGAERSVSIAG